jgi:phosphohistidine phosphatase
MMLYIVRHAWAGEFGDPQWPDDAQRPLTDKGSRRFAGMVETLVTRSFRPEVVATSPMLRCRQTAERIVEGVDPPPELVALDALLPGSDLEALVAWLAQQSAKHEEVAWVGHAPDVGRLAAAMIGQGGWIRFAKGAVAAICFHDTPELAGGELRWLVTAKMLGC